MLYGVLITAADTLLVLWFTRMGIRVIEAFILGLIAIIAGCFVSGILLGPPGCCRNPERASSRASTGGAYTSRSAILGATVMPHNLYLHSALVQTRRSGRDEDRKSEAC